MRTWYHNITKQIFNESDGFDFIEEYDKGDVVYKSEDGCAILYLVEQKELDQLQKEYDEENGDDEEDDEVGDLKDWLGNAFHQPVYATMPITRRTCECDNYRPTSTFGVIIEDCANCGGKAPVTRTGI